jgi:hypothetical protein
MNIGKRASHLTACLLVRLGKGRIGFEEKVEVITSVDTSELSSDVSDVSDSDVPDVSGSSSGSDPSETCEDFLRCSNTPRPRFYGCGMILRN